jgi:type VI protein secretion system component VasK
VVIIGAPQTGKSSLLKLAIENRPLEEKPKELLGAKVF